MRIAIAAFAVLLSAGQSFAATLSASDAAALAGEWRDGCGAEAGGTSVVMEFALTGGTIALDDGTETGGSYRAVSATASKGRVAFAFKDGGGVAFARLANGQLRGEESSGVQLKGLVFQRCRTPADRSAIRLSKIEIAEISSAMPPDNAIFVDARAKGGCKTLDYQYLTVDLVGPLGFSLGRWNSFHLAEMLAGGKKPPLPVDEVSNWTIDKAEAVPGGYRLTVTELIPPNGARGDTTTITLTKAEDGKTAIPEWKRTYLRCPADRLAAH